MQRLLHNIMILLLISLVFLGCTRKSNWDSEINWKDLEFSKLPGAEEYPDEGAIVLHDEGRIETFGDSESGFTTYEKHRIIKILNQRGHYYASVAIPYTPSSKIEYLQARTILPSGKILMVKDEDIYDISLYPDFMLYSDQRAKLFTFPGIENGSIVEYEYGVNYNGHTYGSAWNFQEGVPVLLSRYSLTIPGEAEPRYKISNIEIEPIIKKAPEGFKSNYTWEAKNIHPFDPEAGMPSLKNVLARLNIASVNFETWKDVADWYRNLSANQMKASEEITKLAQQITRGVIDPTEKLKIIFEWVRDNIRYVAVSIGIGSYQPHSAESIFYNRYGDCKDMTTLLCTMAGEVDLDLYPALISTWYNGSLDTSITSVTQFNHMIAYCAIDSEQVIWMDATDKASPFEQLPWDDKGVPVLLVANMDDSKILYTPESKVNENRKLSEWNIELDSTGAAVIEGKDMVWGAPANELRYTIMFLSDKDMKKWMESFVAEKCALTSFDTAYAVGLQPIKDPLSLHYIFKSSGFMTAITENELIFNPGDVSGMNFDSYFLSNKRSYPIRFRLI